METLDINELLGLSADFTDTNVLVEAVGSISPGLQFNDHIDDPEYGLSPANPVRFGEDDDDLVDIETIDEDALEEVISGLVARRTGHAPSKEQPQMEEIETEIITEDFISDFPLHQQDTSVLLGMDNGIEAEDMNSLFEQFEGKKKDEIVNERILSFTAAPITTSQNVQTSVIQPSKYTYTPTSTDSSAVQHSTAAKNGIKVLFPKPVGVSLLANKAPMISIIQNKSAVSQINRVDNLQTKPKERKPAVSLLNRNTKIIQIGNPTIKQLAPSTNTGSIVRLPLAANQPTTLFKPTKMVVKQQQNSSGMPERSFVIVRSAHKAANQNALDSYSELTLAGEVTVETEINEKGITPNSTATLHDMVPIESSDHTLNIANSQVEAATDDTESSVPSCPKADILVQSEAFEISDATSDQVWFQTTSTAAKCLPHTDNIAVGVSPAECVPHTDNITVGVAAVECSPRTDNIAVDAPSAVSSELVFMDTGDGLAEVPDVKTEVVVESEEVVTSAPCPVNIKREPVDMLGLLGPNNGSNVKETMRRPPWLVESEQSSRSSSRRSSRRSSPKMKHRASPSESMLNKIPGYMSEFGRSRSGPTTDDTMSAAASSLLSCRLGHSVLLNRDPSPENAGNDYSRIPRYCSNFTSDVNQEKPSTSAVTIRSKKSSGGLKKNYRSNKSKHKKYKQSKKHRSHKKKRSKYKHSSSSSSDSSEDEVLLVGESSSPTKPRGYRSPDRSRRHSRSNKHNDNRSRRSRSLSSLSRPSCSSRSVSHSRGNSYEHTHTRAHSPNPFSTPPHSSNKRDDSLERDRKQRGGNRRIYRCSSHSDSWSRSRSRSRSHNRKFRNRRGRRRRSRSYNGRSGSDRCPSPRRKLLQERKAAHDKAMTERRVVYVGGISDHCAPSDLRRKFERFGEIENTTLHFRHSGDNYGFVTFLSQRDAESAIEEGNKVLGTNYTLCYGGRRIFCKTDYADLDGCTAVKEEWALNEIKRDDPADDFDLLLKQTLKKIKS